MDANGRKAFWDALLNAKLDNPQSIEALRQAATPPRLLCRFRPVSENSLLQLQKNRLYYSSADYYDDPFDTYFYIDLTNLKQFVETLKLLLASKNESVMKGLDAVAPLLNISSELLVQLLDNTVPDYSELQGQLEVIRNSIQKQLFSICFCEDPFNETLWLKYADNHKGFVQIYDLSCETTFLCRKEEMCRNCPSGQHPPQFYPVFYSDERYDASKFALDCRIIQDTHWGTLAPLVQQFILKDMAWEAERISLIKKKCHEYDQEWRMIRPQIACGRTYVKMRPCTVITGLRMPEYQRRLVHSAATVAGISNIRKMDIDDSDRLNSRPTKEE